MVRSRGRRGGHGTQQRSAEVRARHHQVGRLPRAALQVPSHEHGLPGTVAQAKVAKVHGRSRIGTVHEEPARHALLVQRGAVVVLSPLGGHSKSASSRIGITSFSLQIATKQRIQLFSRW